ncbi:MAG: hypothetical protein EOO71_38385 [Myxococcaceae bacterium]|nr:MAG: hypothetical protein EOO71_38385 [Myxococcaceae bacterium]
MKPPVAATTKKYPPTAPPNDLSAEALQQARAALSSGNVEEAVRKAQRSINDGNNLNAQLLLTELRCRQKNLGLARSEWEKLPESLQRKVEKVCQKHEVDLSL